MKKRYCMTPLQRLFPCGAGWATNYSPDDSETCQDEPMEENCHNIINTDNLHCPYCGGKIKIEESEPLFGTHMKEAIKAIKGK